MVDSDAVTSIEIKKAIVSVLKERPNSSCKYDAIAKYVLKELGCQDLRGQKRDEFCNRIRIAIGHLKRAGVVIRYRSKNERVKLDLDYMSGMARVERMASSNSRTRNSEDGRSNSSLPFDSPSDRERSDESDKGEVTSVAWSQIPRVPRLPEPRTVGFNVTNRDTIRREAMAYSPPQTDQGDEEGALAQALKTMTGMSPQRGKADQDESGDPRDAHLPGVPKDLNQSFPNALSLIDAELSRLYEVESDVTSDRLNIAINDSRGKIHVTVIADSNALQFSVRCVLPLGRSAAEDILRIASDADICSTPYILHYCGEDRIGVRRRVRVRRSEEAASTYEVLGAIQDAVRFLREVRPEPTESPPEDEFGRVFI